MGSPLSGPNSPPSGLRGLGIGGPMSSIVDDKTLHTNEGLNKTNSLVGRVFRRLGGHWSSEKQRPAAEHSGSWMSRMKLRPHDRGGGEESMSWAGWGSSGHGGSLNLKLRARLRRGPASPPCAKAISLAHGCEAREVESLEKLYAQAEGCLPRLRKKVQQWAEHSNGCFLLRESTTFSALSSAATSGTARTDGGTRQLASWTSLVATGGVEGAERRVKWAGIKSGERAIEKLVRSYEGRVARLLDVCRQSVIFRTTHQLAECLRLIGEDDEVVVLQVRNRLRPDYDAPLLSQGYRDVNLSLRFDTPECRRLGIDLHVCEVQLLLSEYALRKSDSGHQRYVAFRNARGR